MTGGQLEALADAIADRVADRVADRLIARLGDRLAEPGNPAETGPGFYSLRVAAQRLGVSEDWVARRRGQLGVQQAGRGCRLQVPVSVIEAIVAGSRPQKEDRALPATPAKPRRPRAGKTESGNDLLPIKGKAPP